MDCGVLSGYRRFLMRAFAQTDEKLFAETVFTTEEIAAVEQQRRDAEQSH
jgi:hypothetical protein